MRRFSHSIVIVGVIAIPSLVLYVTFNVGSCGRFCPFSLRMESHQYFVTPLFGSPWTPKPNELIDYLKRTSRIAAIADKPVRWDSLYHFNTQWRDGMGRPYGAFVRDRRRLIDWSEKHQALADLVWPEAIRLIRSDDPVHVGYGYYLLETAWRYDGRAQDLRSLMDDLEEENEAPMFDRTFLLRLESFGKDARPPAMLDLEDKFLFFPTKHPHGNWEPEGLEFEDVFFTSADGVKLHGWFCPCKEARAVVLHAHGNGGHLAHRASLMRYYQQRLRVTAFIFDYRGYGRSGGTPSAAGILNDARAARTWLANRTGLREKQLVLTGQSLGGAVAVDLAADGARGLVLESTFSSLKDVARHHYPQLAWMASPKKLNSVERVKEYRGPLLMAHGDADDVIPYELGRKLFEAANEPKQWVILPGGVHNHATTKEFADALDAFIEKLPP
jgi:fermentation-respiration switch protein FrsA (DUF1100 family)